MDSGLRTRDYLLVNDQRDLPYLEEAHLLLELSREVSSSLDLQEVLDQSLVALRKLLAFDGGSIQLIEDGALRLAAADPPAPPEAYEFRLPLGEGLGGRAAVTGETIYSPDATIDPRAHPEGRRKASSAGVRSYFAAPLIQHATTIGLVQLDASTIDAFPARAQALVLAFVPAIAAAVQNARLFEREIKTLNELREAERLKDDFLAVVSHELRTPLASVLGLSETLAARVEDLDQPTIVEIATRIQKASRSLKRLIEDVLDLSTIERGRLHVEPQLIPVGPLIADLNATWQSDEHPLRTVVDEDLPWVWADPDRLIQVIQNLLTNARKFSPPGGSITLRATRNGDFLCVSVSDHGKGIAPEMHERIFGRFFQVEEATTRTAGGMGVGLYLARHLCDLMNAGINVESESGHGSTFTVSLRTSAPESNEAEIASASV